MATKILFKKNDEKEEKKTNNQDKNRLTAKEVRKLNTKYRKQLNFWSESVENINLNLVEVRSFLEIIKAYLKSISKSGAFPNPINTESLRIKVQEILSYQKKITQSIEFNENLIANIPDEVEDANNDIEENSEDKKSLLGYL
ncbi:MAG: hypothetical protein EAX96_06505 [Candidatus Lokiarchaeota archaeon]|nr:hypothetical protein [Candidatus Lokiarchaeota archaeon]